MPDVMPPPSATFTGAEGLAERFAASEYLPEPIKLIRAASDVT